MFFALVLQVGLFAEGLSVPLVSCGLSSGWTLCTGCQNRSAPAGDQVWTAFFRMVVVVLSGFAPGALPGPYQRFCIIIHVWLDFFLLMSGYRPQCFRSAALVDRHSKVTLPYLACVPDVLQWVLGTNTCRNLSCLLVVKIIKAG
eukprot:132644-Pelagomonas_calceolata.AAC.10